MNTRRGPTAGPRARRRERAARAHRARRRRDSGAGELAPALAADLGGEGHRLTRGPAVRLEKIADTADGVRRTRGEVGLPVAVVVHRETPVRARHELGNADRSR